ncbi:phosphoribulokinase [Nitrosococcus watsonii]|uniref:Phosphoribulokinase n=1 Tax=Nitrosococcus watsoni (strain C-113) TaxID=105559 RepID=D8K922_NITWC|nr:phosphoribulokinase [Nitrosococcus watsonii]ADJ27232.1 Phosphoribulokinase [Nitrosococcus watsonii C-113]
MSVAHPIIAVTGSSGAGTSTVKQAFSDMFRREGIRPVVIEGDSFHRYDRQTMKEKTAEYEAQGKILTHFGPEANELEKLEALFREYSEQGTGKKRLYIHSEEEGEPYNQAPGTFTPWEPIDSNSHLLFYEGLHGGVVTDQVNVARYVDLLVGVVPVVNLEWIQKIHRDCLNRGYSSEAVVQIILKRMPDYVHYISPQFSHTHINFQRVPLVDTSNPFIARDIPTPDESKVVIRFRDPHMADFPYYLNMLKDSFMSRANTLVVPGGKMGLAMEIVLTPVIHGIMEKKRARG